MRQQNADMQSTTIIPIFGYTPSVGQQRINIKGDNTTVELAMATTPEVIRIEATPLTWNLHKYLVVIRNHHKKLVFKTIQGIFNKITEPLENQLVNFPYPRCGGRENKESAEKQEITTTMMAYMTKLESIATAQNPQDAGPAEPPKRHRKITILYAGAVKAGILKQPNHSKITTANSNNITQESDSTYDTVVNPASQRQVSWDGNTTDTSRSTGSSLSRSITNSKIQSFKKDIDNEIQELKTNFERQLDNQDKHITEMIDLIHTMNKSQHQSTDVGSSLQGNV
jgi:hypothetical protein